MDRKKKLTYLSWRRGTRENDLILGRFAEACLHVFSDNDLDIYEELLKAPDPDIYLWITERTEPPSLFSSLIQRIRIFYQ